MRQVESNTREVPADEEHCRDSAFVPTTRITTWKGNGPTSFSNFRTKRLETNNSLIKSDDPFSETNVCNVLIFSEKRFTCWILRENQFSVQDLVLDGGRRRREEANFYLEKSKIFYMRSKLSLLEDRQRKKWKTKERERNRDKLFLCIFFQGET